MKKFIFLVIIGFMQPGFLQAQSLFGDRVKEMNEWNQLFIHQNGWFGGDGIFAIPLDGKEFIPATDDSKTAFVFGDTMIGTITADKVAPGDFSMIHNSIGILTGKQPKIDNINFY